MKISFMDNTTGNWLGDISISPAGIRKLNVGDFIEFKSVASILGMFRIVSFAVNDDAPEGMVYLEPLKAKARIKLLVANDALIDNELPF